MQRNIIADISYGGHLTINGETIPVYYSYASRYSLFIKFLKPKKFQKGTEILYSSIKINHKEFDLGKCTYHLLDDNPDFDGRLVFSEKVYDFYTTFRKGSLVDSLNYYENLSLVFIQKDLVKKEFKSYITDLSYDLNVYKRYFDEIDIKITKEPEEIRQNLQQVIIDNEGRHFIAYFDNKLDELNRLVKHYTKEEHEQHGFYLRKQLWSIITKSEGMLRTNIRPRGYPGDSEMMQMIYENGYRGNSIFEKLMHKHPVETLSAQAIRNRKKLIVQNLFKEEKKNASTSFDILSVACGPAAELENIIISPEICKKYQFTFLDQDPLALAEVEEMVKEIETRMDQKINHKYLYESVRSMIAIRDIAETWGQFDFIYAMGLFDYLNAKVAKAVLKKLYQMLRPGGLMLIGNFHSEHKTRVYLEYWMDWPLIYRNEEEFLDLAAPLENAVKEITFEETGSQMFLHIHKNSPAKKNKERDF